MRISDWSSDVCSSDLWTTHEALKATHTLRMQDEAGVLGIGLAPDFAINQRALYLPTDAGNILWECLSLVTDEAVAALQARGGVDLIAISHRSEERRVGNECGITCRFRWSPKH